MADMFGQGRSVRSILLVSEFGRCVRCKSSGLVLVQV